MAVKPDHWIRRMARDAHMIEPFSERVAGEGIISYGLQPAGYDARLDPRIQIVDWVRGMPHTHDPLNPLRELYFEQNADPYFVIPNHGFIVGRTLEYFRIPRNCVVRGAAKTIYSSVGVNFDVASIHPGWEGHLVLHIANTTPVPVKIYGGMGIIYVEFHEIDGEVERDYSELKGTRFQGKGRNG